MKRCLFPFSLDNNMPHQIIACPGLKLPRHLPDHIGCYRIQRPRPVKCYHPGMAFDFKYDF